MRIFFTVLLSLSLGALNAQVINTFPTYDDLESWTLCSQVCSVACVISSDWSNVGGIDFRPDTAGTPTGSTGPSVDHNPGSSSGVYAYVESSAPCNPDTALLQSPFIDLTNVLNPSFTFWHHQLTATSIPDTFDVLVSTDSGGTWSTLYTGPNNTSANTWVFDSINLNAYVGSVLLLQIRFITANAFNDFAVDDFTFNGVQIIDAGIDSLYSSNGFCLGDSSNLCVNLVNDGILTIDSVTIYSTLNGGSLFSPFVFQDTLGPGEDTVICLGSVLLSTGDSIAAYTDMPNGLNDTFNLNDTVAFSVVMNNPPAVDAGADTTICGLISFPLGGFPTGPVGSTFQWTPGTYLNNTTLGNPTGYFTSGGTYQYIVDVLDTNNCSAMDTVNITVHPIPTIDAGADTMVCPGSSATIGGSPTAHASSSILWSNGQLLNDSTIQNPTATVQSSTTFILTVTDTNGCSFLDTVDVDIFPSPNLDAGQDTSVCANDSVTIGGTPVATQYSTLNWTPTAGLSNASAENPNASPTAQTTYTVNITDTFGCDYQDSVVVDVKPLPAADAGADTLVCAFDSFTVGGSPTGPATATYRWMPGVLFNDSTAANPSVLVSQDTALIVVVTDTLSMCSRMDTIQVSILPLPLADAGADTHRLCTGDTVTLGGSPTTLAINSVLWSPGHDLDDSTAMNPVLTADSTYTIVLEVTEPVNGCRNYDSVRIIHSPVPQVEAGINYTICIGDSAVLGGAPTSSISGSSYQWSNPGVLNNDTIANPTATPTQDTMFTVTVTTPAQCVNTDSIFVFINPLPTIGVQPYTQACLGDSIQLNVTGGVDFQWNMGQFLSDSTIANPKASAPTDTTFIVTVTDANGCVDTAHAFVDFYELPVVSAGPDDTICFGLSTTLQATGAVNYFWSPSQGLNDNTIANPTASPNNSTEYIVEGTDGNGCTTADTMFLLVNPLPNVNAGPDLGVCQNDSIQIGGSPTGPAGSQFIWDSPQLIDSLVANPIFDAVGVPVGNYTITVEVEDLNGCIDTDQMVLTVLDDPVAVINPIANSICIGDSIDISASGGVSFQWAPAATLTSTNTQQTTAYPVVTTEYFVTVTDVNGCESSTSDFVNVFPLTPAEAGPDQSICQQDTITLGASGGVSYQWESSLFLSDESISNPLAYPVATETLTVWVTDANGCTEPDSLTIEVYPLPIAAAGGDARICVGETTTLGGAPTGPAGAQFNWSPANSLNNAGSANPVAAPSSTTRYFVTVTSSDGCSDTSSVMVVVDSIPVIEVLKNTSPVCLGDTAEILVTSGYTSYQWDPAAMLHGDLRDSVGASPKKDAEYSVTVTNKHGCSSSTSTTVVVLPLPELTLSDPAEICNGETTKLTVSGGTSYRWSNAETLSDSTASRTFASPRKTTTYSVTATDDFGCQNDAAVQVTVFPLPYVDAGEDLDNCDIDVVYLGGEPSGPADAVYLWSPETGLSDPMSPNPSLLNAEREVYYLEVQDRNGCFNTDSVVVNADCYAYIYAPSAFTPGDNELNDEFKLEHYRVVEPHLQIFDRWGHLVFETHDLDEGWDGSQYNTITLSLSAVYFWVLTYKTEDAVKESAQGTVTLIR